MVMLCCIIMGFLSTKQHNTVGELYNIHLISRVKVDYMIEESRFLHNILKHPGVTMVKALSNDPNFPTWILSNRTIVMRLCNAQKQPYNELRKRIFSLMYPALAVLPGVLRILIFLITMPATLRWRAMGRKGRVKQEKQPIRIFVCHNAGGEKSLLDLYKSLKPEIPVRVVDSCDPKSFMNISRIPDKGSFIKLLWGYSGEVVRAFNHKEFSMQQHRSALYITASQIMPAVVCCHAWWQALDTTLEVDEVCFLASLSPAYAFKRAARNFSTVFLQHGLLSPFEGQISYDKVISFNSYEALYLQNITKSAHFKVLSASKQVIDFQPIVLFASTYDTTFFQKEHNLETLTMFLTWCNQQGLKIIVRKHRLEQDTFWQDLMPNLEINKKGQSIEQALHFYRPMFLASWFSTALVEAHSCGVLPIILDSQQAEAFRRDIVYPLDENFFMFPRDKVELQSKSCNLASPI
jgi:hypothetical protein